MGALQAMEKLVQTLMNVHWPRMTAATTPTVPTPLEASNADARKAGSLIKPTSFSLVWNDRGSGADADVSIYKMKAPSGYTCLGAVAVASFQTKPDKSRYCCVKDDYVVKADTIRSWNDKGSGANSDVSWWTVVQALRDSYGLNAGNFIGVQGYSKPNDQTTYLLKGDNNKVRRAPRG